MSKLNMVNKRLSFGNFADIYLLLIQKGCGRIDRSQLKLSTGFSLSCRPIGGLGLLSDLWSGGLLSL